MYYNKEFLGGGKSTPVHEIGKVVSAVFVCWGQNNIGGYSIVH